MAVQTPLMSGTPDEIMQAMLRAGVHFGHQTKRWNPKMKPYIHSARNGIHILDLDQTLPMLVSATELVSDLTANGRKILFVGTKKQAQDVVAQNARRSGQFFVNRRWLGGTLTNFVTIKQRLKLLKDLQQQEANNEFDRLPKQEASVKRKQLERLERTLGGMKDMTTLPGAVFVIDAKRETLAIAEARKLGIPIIAMTDSNADPDLIDYVIPANDDAIRSLRLITSTIGDAALEGATQYETRTLQDMGIDEKESGGEEAIVEEEVVEVVEMAEKATETNAESTLKAPAE